VKSIFRKRKIILISVMILIFFISSFSVLLTHLVKTNHSKNKTNSLKTVVQTATAGYNLNQLQERANNGMTYDEMINFANSYNHFSITDESGYWMFVYLSCAYFSGGEYRPVVNYAGKTVTLENDIEINKTGARAWFSCAEFAGTFNGNGHTIKANYWGSETRAVRWSSGGLYQYTGGSFVIANKGTIKNLCLDNWSISLGGSANTTSNCSGVIAHDNQGTIESCIVQNFQFKTNVHPGYVAAISYYNSGTINSCLVQGFAKFETIWGTNLYTYYFSATSDNPAMNCIYAPNEIVCHGQGGSYHPSVHDSAIFNINNNYSSFAEAYYWTSEDYDNAGTAYGLYGYWYAFQPGFEYHPKECAYDNGKAPVIYLRNFISWTTYSFVVNPANGGTLKNSNDILIPTSVYPGPAFTENGNKLTSTYWKRTVTATPAANWNFIGWTSRTVAGGEQIFYIANFEKYCIVSFAEAENVEYTNKINVEFGTQYIVDAGTAISITWTKDLIKQGCYTFVRFEFVDKSGTIRCIGYSINNNKFYISGSTITSSNFENSKTVNSNLLNIRPLITEKTYNVLFK
jgi:hypothetical protein